ncbi:MAG: prepilin-type N-terminal cleavage/methylation domain-containing protein [Chloroflexi bacterium]|nr:prepilin-type N-terminal cleavage/methylation domain-containing protein [Chloroflexota bacterium]
MATNKGRIRYHRGWTMVGELAGTPLDVARKAGEGQRRLGTWRRTGRAWGNQRGLTALELAVVMATLAVLAGIVAVSTSGLTSTARRSTKSADIAEVQRAIDGYRGQHPRNYFPVSPEADTLIADTQIDFAASITTPEGVTKRFVPDFLQKEPNHADDTPSSWRVAPNGKVTNTLDSGDY